MEYLAVSMAPFLLHLNAVRLPTWRVAGEAARLARAAVPHSAAALP